MLVKEIFYTKDKFNLSRRIYEGLPEELRVTKEGDIIQQADSPHEDEFIVLKIDDGEVFCEDTTTHLKRFFYLDSVRISEKELKRIKHAKVLAKKAEAKRKRQEKEQKRIARTIAKLERETLKKNRKLKFKKKRELKIKFI